MKKSLALVVSASLVLASAFAFASGATPANVRTATPAVTHAQPAPAHAASPTPAHTAPAPAARAPRSH